MYLVKLLLGLMTKPTDVEQDEYGNWWRYERNIAVFERDGVDARVRYYRMYLKAVQNKWGVWEFTDEQLMLDQPLKYYREVYQGLAPGEWEDDES